MAWRFPGSATDDLEHVVLEGVGNGHGSLQRVHGNHLRGVGGHAGRGDVDEREMVAGGEHSSDAVRRRGTLLDQGIRDRGALGGAPANERELVGAHQLGRAEEVEDELRRLVDAERSSELLLGSVLGSGGSELHAKSVMGGIPRRGYRQRDATA